MAGFLSIVIGLGTRRLHHLLYFYQKRLHEFSGRHIASPGPLRLHGVQEAATGRKFTELFPDALTMIARSLRSGHSFTSAIELVGTEASDPVGPCSRPPMTSSCSASHQRHSQQPEQQDRQSRPAIFHYRRGYQQRSGRQLC